MGTTSEKLTYLNTTKTLIKEELNLGGANISTEPFRAYSSKLKGIYKDFLAHGTDVLWNNWEKVSGSGETLSLTPTIKGKMKVDLKGNTYQYSTTGKNKIETTLSGSYANLTVSQNNDKTINISGTPNRNWFNITPIISKTLTNGDYVFSINKTLLFNIGLAFFDSDNTQTKNFYINAGNTSATGTIDSSDVKYRIYVDGMSQSTNYNISSLGCQLESGSSSTSYEPYTNGASPNPDYPQDIQVVSGDNTIKVEGKNLFDINSYPILEYAFYDGKGNPVFWAGTCGIREYIKLDENSTYAIKYNGSNNFLICFYDENKTHLSQLTKASGGNFTMPSTAKYIRFGIATAIENVEWCQIEKGSTATTYEPYVSHTYPISLGNIELCKIGTYQDSIVKDNGKWYLNKQIGKVVLDGSETGWNVYGTGTDNWFYYVGTSHIPKIQLNNQDTGYCSHYIPINVGTATTDYGMSLLTNGIVRIRYGQEDVVSNYTNWLSTHNVSIYYILTTPTYEEITDTTLLSQLEALAYSYEGTTNISQVNDDLAFVLDITALKEMS